MSSSSLTRSVTPKLNNKIKRKSSTSRSPILEKTQHSRSQTKIEFEADKYSPLDRSQIMIN